MAPDAFHGPSHMKEAKSKALYRALLDNMRGSCQPFNTKLISFGKGNCRLGKQNLDAVAEVGPIYARVLEYMRRHTSRNHGILCCIVSGKGLFGSDKTVWAHWLVWVQNCRAYGTGVAVAEKGSNGYANVRFWMCGEHNSEGNPVYKHSDLSLDEFVELDIHNICVAGYVDAEGEQVSALYIGGLKMEKMCNNPTCVMKACKDRYANHHGLDVNQQVEEPFSKSQKRAILQKIANGVQPRMVQDIPAPRVPDKKAVPSGVRSKMEAKVGKNRHTRHKDDVATGHSQKKKPSRVHNTSDEESESSDEDVPVQHGKSTGFRKKNTGKNFLTKIFLVNDPKPLGQNDRRMQAEPVEKDLQSEEDEDEETVANAAEVAEIEEMEAAAEKRRDKKRRQAEADKNMSEERPEKKTAKCIYMCICVNIYLYMYIYICIQVYICIQICIYVCRYI